MTNIIKLLTPFILIGSLIISGCVKDEFDVPPLDGETVDIVANTSIADLKANFNGFDLIKLTDNQIISGVVVADDRSGNFYKTIVIQDATGGLGININLTDAYNLYPIGRELFIKTQGLVLGDDNGVVVLGEYIYEEDGRQQLGDIINLNQYIIKGQKQEIELAQTVTINELNDDLANSLVTIENVQFVAEDKGQDYADAIGKRSLSRTLIDCEGNEITLRTSGYADFASAKTPNLGGVITGIYTPFRGAPQLFIRSLEDVNLTQELDCGNVGGGNSGGGSGGGSGNGGGSSDNALIQEGFDNATVDAAVQLAGWMNTTVNGNLMWETSEYSNNNYAEINPFNSGETNAETWLITPAFDLAEANTLQFESMMHHWQHAGLSVWISTNFSGNVANADWTELSATFPQESTEWYEWIDSGVIDLSSFNGTAYIGFKYVGDADSNSTAFSIDNVVVK